MGSGAATGMKLDDEMSYYQESSDRAKIRPQPSVNPLGISEKSRRTMSVVVEAKNPDAVPTLTWPKPSSIQLEPFNFSLGTLDDNYSIDIAFMEEMNKLTLVTSKDDREQIKQQFLINMQKESSNQSDIIAFSNQNGTAALDTEISAKSHFCVNLQTEEQVNVLLQHISSLYLQYDSVLQQQFTVLSKQTQLMIVKLTGTVQEKQQDLLKYAKEKQEQQNQLYNQFLGEYVKVLNEWKTNELNKLQQFVTKEQGRIVKASQHLMIAINQSSSSLRNQILTSASGSIDTEVNQFVGQINIAAASKIGTQLKAMIGIRIDGEAGERFPPGTCPFEDFNSEGPTRQERKKAVSVAKPSTVIQRRAAKQTFNQSYQRATEKNFVAENIDYNSD